MHDLRLWTIAFAPSKQNNLRRLQELHRINNEAIYLINRAIGKRILVAIFLYFLINKIAKHKINHGAKDSHDTNWRDNTSTL